MNEDVSAYWRLAATIVLVAELIAVILAIATIGSQLFNAWQLDQTMKTQVAYGSVAMQLAQEGEISSLVAYKFLDANVEMFGDGDIRIVYYDDNGNQTELTDMRQLLRHPLKKFDIDVKKKSNGFYQARLTEVSP